VMAEEFHVRFPSSAAATSGAEKLLGLRLEDQPLMRVEQRGSDLFAACAINSVTSMESPVRRAPAPESPVGAASESERKFGELFAMVHAMRSGKHHPDGMLWVGSGRHRVHAERIPLTAVAPTILRHFGVAPPPQMTGSSVAGPLEQALVATAS
jgi:hypothetical protein